MHENKQVILEVNDLSKYFRVGQNLILKAIDKISFTINKGETLGVVGESGCGKTTLGRTILLLTPPNQGEVLFNNVNLTKINSSELRKFRKYMQIVFQDPYSSLNPRMTIRETLILPMKLHQKYSGEELKRASYLLDRVGLRKTDLNRYPHEFSGGQLQRIGIARTLSVDPVFIVADEPVSALDVSIQSQVLNLFKEIQEELKLTYLFIAHDLSVVEFISHRIAVLYLGKIVELGDSNIIYKSPKHPYTKFLLSAVIQPDPILEQQKEFQQLSGEIASPINPKPICRFYSRCPDKRNICQEKEPELLEIENEQFIACFLYQ